ncbi:MAG: diacylglycerol kinase family lipid kinase [Butyrivibrio sp.]|nr:diacylglycerol kinase family lipid kinase [Butyrivibrio sp.]
MKNEPKMLFIYNPRAGKERIRSHLLDLIDTFAQAGYEVTACPTQGVGHAVHAVLERRDGYDLITCAGGDGTLDEVVGGMMRSEKKLPIGYIPAGSTNDFAVSLGIPSAMQEAAKIAVYGRDFACDVGVMNNAFFVYTAAFGLFTEVSYETKHDMKKTLGYAAYLLEGIKSLSEIRSYHVRVTCGQKTVEEDCMLGMVTNSVSIGGIRQITGVDVDLQDGLFEVTLIKMPRNMLDLSDIITGLMNREIETDMIDSFKADHVIVESDEEIAWTRDGEYGGTHQRVEIENRHKGIVIRVPRTEEEEEAEA